MHVFSENFLILFGFFDSVGLGLRFGLLGYCLVMLAGLLDWVWLMGSNWAKWCKWVSI